MRPESRPAFERAREVSRRAVRRARVESLLLLFVLVGLLVLYEERRHLIGSAWDTPACLLTAVLLVVLGWQLARDVGHAIGPSFLRRLEPATAGTLGFIARLVTMLVVAAFALRLAGLDPRTVALGGAITAVIVGLAAQQTLGNMIAGTVLVSARTLRVGDRVRLQGGGLAGTVEGVVSSVGLLYTTIASGDDPIMVPNSVVLGVALVPLREPQGVRLRARLRAGVTPGEVQEQLERSITTRIRSAPRVTLEELDGDDVVVTITATPVDPSEGARLAAEVLQALSSQVVHAEAPAA
jgi:small conductance mechanosensitive channel